MPETRRIPLDRRVLVVRDQRIELRPERAAIIFPLVGLAIGGVLFFAIARWADGLSVWILFFMLLGAMLITPFSAMGLVYSIIGNAVVIEKPKQSVRFHQGVLGLGLGTMELVPFWKIDRIEVEDFDLGNVSIKGPPPPLDLRAWDIILVKTNGKRLPIAQVLTANRSDLIDEAWDRALDAAEAIGAMVEKPVVITAEIEEPAEEEAKAPAPAEPAGEASREERGGQGEAATG